jgi:cytochrome c-type biogenesis protein CcmF
MTVLVGRVCLGIALLAAAATVAGGWQAARGGPVGVWLRRGPLVAFASLVAAFGVLQYALLTDDFTVRYVAQHHRRATPTLFTVTSAWAGLEGSLLLWALVIGLYLFVASRRVARAPGDRLGAGALVVMGVVAGFFTTLVLVVAPTFSAAPAGLRDGNGANPLLQDNMLMAIHPPLLYLGYVGFMVPFAFALSALALRERGPRWVLRTQTWAVVAWAFLTAGIVIGGWWSYDVLGWGGYWAWDPVENASFLPWLAGTAYLHSAVMQARRGMLPAWSVGLIVSSFLFTLLGTFLARSGVIASVHAFSQSSLGPVLLVFLLAVTAVVVWLFVTRLRDVVTGPPLQSLASREGVFLLNNLLLATFAVVVLVGTTYPIVVEAISDDRISVGRPFFDVFAVWITLALLLAMCVGVVMPYRRASLRTLWEHQRLPVQCGLGFAALLVVVAGLRAPYVIVVAALSGTIVATAWRELVLAVRGRTDHRGRRVAAAAALRAKPGFWGGQLAHVGLAIVTLGIAASSNLAERSTVTLQPGQTATASGFEITYLQPTAGRTSSYTARGALLRLSRNGDTTTVEPAFHQYPNQREPIGQPAVWTTPGGDDAYVALLGLDDAGVTLHLYRYPWMLLVWVGGLTMAAGGALGLLLRAARSRSDRVLTELLNEPAEPVDA